MFKEVFKGVFYIRSGNEYADLINSGKLKELKYVGLRGEFEQFLTIQIFEYEGRKYIFSELRGKHCYIGFKINDITVLTLGYKTDIRDYVDSWRKHLSDVMKWTEYQVIDHLIGIEHKAEQKKYYEELTNDV